MPDWNGLFGELRAAEVFAWFAAAIALIGGLVLLLRKALPVLKKLTDFLDDVAGEPARPGVPARPGLMERVASIEARQTEDSPVLKRVHHELFPNSGKSMRDQTNRLERKLDDHIALCIGLEQAGKKETP